MLFQRFKELFLKTPKLAKPTILKNRIFFTLCCFLLSLYTYAQAPAANFTATVTSGCSPLVINFQDQSSGNPTSWLWDFGNGATSTLRNPATTYFNPGTFTITLTASNAGGSNTLIRTAYITVYDKPSVAFAVNDSVGCFPFRAQFTDQTVAAPGTSNVSWFWDFGNGTQSTQQNPTVTYASPGDYTITFKVTNDKGCSRVLTKQQYIHIVGNLNAGFTNTQPMVCRPPVSINFTNTTTGAGTLSYSWNFGDGTNSTVISPQHNYTTPGNYTVTLAIISSEGCKDTVRKTNLITIQNINTTFTAPDSICINAVTSFQNTSTPTPANSNWNFGDGTTATVLSPTKVFTTPGTYNVTLYNTYSYCSDSITKPIKILPRPKADFIATTPTFRCEPSLPVTFQDQSVNAVRWLWNFGDSTTSTQQNPTHNYTAYGSFNVQLIVTNSSGCTDTLKKNAFVKVQRPVITFPNLPLKGCIPYTMNFTANINSVDAVTSYFWDLGDGVTSTLANPIHTYAAQGTYTVKLRITTATGCSDSLVVSSAVKVGRKPVIDFTATPNPVCAYQPVQFTNLTNESDEWIWNFGDGISSNLQNPLHPYTDTGTLTVQLIATNNGCQDSLTKPKFIRIKPPIARFNYTPNCDNRLLFNFRDSSIGATSWFWEFGDGTTSTLQNPPHVYSAYGAYTVKLTVTNDTCSHFISKPIKLVNENPDFVADRTSACRIAQIGIRSIVSDPGNIVSYFWDTGDGGGGSSGNSTIGPTYVNAGLYTVTLVTIDINGCKDTATKQNYIRINGPTANFSAANNSGCKGLTTTFNDLSQSDGISNIVSWRWDFGDGTVQTYTAAPFQHTYTKAGVFTVKLIVRDAGGCSDSLTIPALVTTSEPKADFTSADTLSCPGAAVQFSNLTTSANYANLWSFGDGSTSTVNAPAQVYSATGVYSVKLLIQDQYGCQDSITKANYIKVAKPIASFTVSDSVSSCTPFEVIFTNTSQYYSSSLWDLGGGISTAKDPVNYYNSTGLYKTRLIITSPGGCTDTAFKNITVYDTVGTKLQYQPFNGCTPLSVNLNAFTPGPVTYTWDFGDGNLITTTTPTINHSYIAFGTFTPKVIMTDPAGCIFPVPGDRLINIIGATAKFGLDKKFFCDSGFVTFKDSTTFNDSVTTYNWSFGDGTTSNLQNPRHQYTAPGFYTVSLNVKTVSGCAGTLQLDSVIKIVESPLIAIRGDSVICVNETISHAGVFQRPDTSVVTWNWKFPNGNTASVQNPVTQQYTTAGTLAVNAIATNSSGCANTATQTIVVNPLPVITMPSTITKVVGVPLTIPATYSSNVMSYLWSPAATLSCTNCPQPVATPKFNTRYTVSVVDSNSCRSAGNIQVVVICKGATIFLPNTFSPNGDGSNDVFYMRGQGLDRVKSLRIFNRWGEIVFEQRDFPVNNPANGWNGKYKGNKPHPDVYIYQVEVFCENSEIVRFEGNVALIQ